VVRVGCWERVLLGRCYSCMESAWSRARQLMARTPRQERAELLTGTPVEDPVSAVGYDTGKAIPAGYPLGTSARVAGIARRTATAKPAIAASGGKSGGVQQARATVAALSGVGMLVADALRHRQAVATQSYPEGGVAAGLREEPDRAAGAIGVVEASTRQAAWRVPSLAGRDRALAPYASWAGHGRRGSASVRAGRYAPW